MEFVIRKAGKKISDSIFKDWNQEAVDHLHFDDGFTFIAEVESEIIGFISAGKKEKNEIFIDIIDVKEKWRRQGIGSGLVEAAIEESRKIGAKKIKSWSSLDKKAAICMWKSLGFELRLAKTISRITKGPVEGYIVTKNI